MKQPPVTAPIAASKTINVAVKKVAVKKVKLNPSFAYIGMKVTSTSGAQLINFRQGKSNQVNCDEVLITMANPTGRRLTAIFKLAGVEVMSRRIYKEHFEKIADKFGVIL